MSQGSQQQQYGQQSGQPFPRPPGPGFGTGQPQQQYGMPMQQPVGSRPGPPTPAYGAPQVPNGIGRPAAPRPMGPPGGLPPHRGPPPRPTGFPGAPTEQYPAPAPRPGGPPTRTPVPGMPTAPGGPYQPTARPAVGGPPHQPPQQPMGGPRPTSPSSSYGVRPSPPGTFGMPQQHPPPQQQQNRPPGAVFLTAPRPLAGPPPAGGPPGYGMRPPGGMGPPPMPGAPRPLGQPQSQSPPQQQPPPRPQMPGMAMSQQPQQLQQQQRGGYPGSQPGPTGSGVPSFGAPPSSFGAAQQTPGMGPSPPPAMRPTGMQGPAPPGLGMTPGPGMAMGGYDASAMTAALDAFESLSLGPSGPSVPGGQPAPAANAATFPRPAGTQEQQEAAVGPAPPYTPYNCNPIVMRMTAQAAPNSQALKARWHLPYGAIVHPLAERGGHVPVANPGGASIIRCKRCRTYMNPWMTWSDGGRRFACNVCATVNETPVDYFSALDATGRRLDVDQRPELSTGSVEYVAPAEYMVRAPMPPTYVFLIDVSFAATAAGMIATACAAIKACLGSLPGDDRTRVAIMTFDAAIHFYALRPGAAGPQMMVVGEIEEPFVPLPDELLVNLAESRSQVDRLLDSIPASFARNQRADSAMGPALQAAFMVMNHIGGKLLLFQAAVPSLGIGKIKARDNPALYGTDREYALRAPDDPFYKRFSAEASRFQICIDVFACGSAYQDLPSLGALPRYTGGQLYYYPGFSVEKDGNKMHMEIVRNLTRETTWEAVMRIRCSKGLRISAFFGHFFVRSTDLLALPACDADKTFAVEISHEESVVTGQVAYVQSALLYTSSQGERRIRVHTLAIPVVSDLLELYKASDCGATAALLAKVCIERSLSSKLDDVRSSVQHRLSCVLREYRMLHMRGPPGMGPPPTTMVLPERLKSLPLLTLGVVKTAALRGSGRDVNTDERAAVAQQITAASVSDILRLVYPSCFRVDNPSGNWGRVAQDGSGAVELPPIVPAGLEYFDPSGAHLIDNGRIMVLWIGSAAPQSFYSAVFGPSANPNDSSSLRIEPPQQGSDLSLRLCSVVAALRACRELHQEVHVVRQGTPLEAHVMPYFVEDRGGAGGGGQPGYLDWMMGLQKAVMAKQ